MGVSISKKGHRLRKFRRGGREKPRIADGEAHGRRWKCSRSYSQDANKRFEKEKIKIKIITIIKNKK
jgi:hypothetical protein